MHSQYNILPPNTMQYNVTDAIDLTFGETVSVVEVQAKIPSKPLVDTILGVDILTKTITDKRLLETLRLNEWFTVKQAPQSDPWS